MAGYVEQKTFEEQDWRGVSVVMMQNLPCRCSQEEIESAVEELGFAPHVNYFHLPRKSPNGRNLGYGFIGFVNAELTQKFRDVFEGYTLKSRTSSKQLKLAPAHQQQIPVPDKPQPNVLTQQQASLPSWLQGNMLADQRQASLPNWLQVSTPAHQQQASLPNFLLADGPLHQQQASLSNRLQAETPAYQQQAHQQPSTPDHLQANMPAHQLASLPPRLHATVSFSQQEEIDFMVTALQQEASLLQEKIDLMVASLKSDWPMQTCCSSQLVLSAFSSPAGSGQNASLLADVDSASIEVFTL